MKSIANTTKLFLGCDVGKNEIVIHVSTTGETLTLPNESLALKAGLKRFFDGSVDLAVCEATGGYEKVLLATLLQLNIPAHRACARKVKAYIRSLGTLAKTDKIDARMLASYGAERQANLVLWTAPDETQETIAAMMEYRQDLSAHLVAAKNRLQAPSSTPVRASIKALIRTYEKQLAAMDKAVTELIENDRQLRQRYQAMVSIKGVGATTAKALMAFMPELGSLNKRQAAALAGLAPHPRQSGQTTRYAVVRGGRPKIKRTLFMAALVAARHNTVLAAFYQKLIQNGKKPMVAITAVMRKLITIINAVIRDSVISLQVS